MNVPSEHPQSSPVCTFVNWCVDRQMMTAEPELFSLGICRGYLEDWGYCIQTQKTSESRTGSCQTQYVIPSFFLHKPQFWTKLKRVLTLIQQVLWIFVFCWFASFRISTTSSCSTPTLDNAERPFGSGCVSHWSPRTPQAINCYAISCEYSLNSYTHCVEGQKHNISISPHVLIKNKIVLEIIQLFKCCVSETV